MPTEPSSHSHHLTIRFILWISLWTGLVTGILEVLIQIIRKFGLHQIIGLSLDLIWMAPLADALIFLAVGLLFSLYAGRFARVNNIRVLVFILAFLGAFSTIQYLPLHWIARDILVVGITMVCSTGPRRSVFKFYLLAQKTTPVLIVLVALSGIGLRAFMWNIEKQNIANLPAADPGLPNILLIVMDTVRAENLSLYGYHRDTTPVLQGLSQEGVMFKQAFATAPWTLPSHASIFTGRWPHEMSADWLTPLDKSYPILAEILQKHGYETAGFVGNISYVSYEHGLNRGFIHYEDYRVSAGQILVSSAIGRATWCWRMLFSRCIFRKLTDYYQILGRKNAQEVNRETLNWIADHREKPYFIFINYFDAHWPFLPPEPFDSVFDSKRPRFSKVYVGVGIWNGDRGETQREVNAYDESIRYVDFKLGALLDQMRSQGLLENTLIIITSDHGEEFQEHRVMGHGNSLYRQSVQVPLLMIFPDYLPSGVSVPEPVSLRNIPATVLDIIGLSKISPFPGQTLTNFLDNSGKLPDVKDEFILNEVSYVEYRPSYYPISHGDMKSIIFDGLRYIRNKDGTEELYDFYQDPEEKNDLADTPQGLSALPEYRRLLQDILAQSSMEKPFANK